MDAIARGLPAQEVSSRQRSRLRERSKLFFGNQDRLEVLVAIARSHDGLVNATDLQQEIDIAHNRIRNQLVVLSRVGLLTKFPQGGGKIWYQRVDSSVWEVSLFLYQDWTR